VNLHDIKSDVLTQRQFFNTYTRPAFPLPSLSSTEHMAQCSTSEVRSIRSVLAIGDIVECRETTYGCDISGLTRTCTEMVNNVGWVVRGADRARMSGRLLPLLVTPGLIRSLFPLEIVESNSVVIVQSLAVAASPLQAATPTPADVPARVQATYC
jgi:hypothetical protein